MPKTSFSLSLSLVAAFAGCSGERARPDAGPPVDAGEANDAGETDAGETDAGATVDAGEATDAGSALEPETVLQLRDQDLSVFGSDVIASVILARPAAVYAGAGCRQYADAQPALPRLGAIAAEGLTVSGLSCSSDVGTGIDGTRCLGQPAGPPPVSGSTLDTGPWLTAADPTLSVAAGPDLGAVSATLGAPTTAAEITTPSALPTTVDGDLTVAWGALGHLDVQIEVEVQTGGEFATVVCAPDTDGEVVVPQALLGDRILRISVGNYTETVVRDGEDRGLRVQVLRGRIISE